MADHAAGKVRKGQRRTLAARRAGLAAVRVLVEPAPQAAEDDTAG
jgi:ParB-like chromosome segregation protein Spo0J